MGKEFVDLHVRILCCRTQLLGEWGFPNLSAPYWRLYRNESRGAEIVVDGRRVELLPSRFVVIPPDTPYAARLVRPVRHFFLHFVTRSAYRQARPEVYSFPVSREFRGAVEEIAMLLEQPEDSSHRLSTLALLLAHAALACAPHEHFVDDFADERVRESVTHMRERLAEKIVNARLAEMARMNANAFVRLFRQQTGATPQAYLTRLRIERACILLHYTDGSVDEIAAETGFCDRYHLSRVFKRARGMGPAAFRRLMASAAR